MAPIPENAAEWLARYGLLSGPIVDFKVRWQTHRSATKAGVTWKANGLRHTFITYRLAEIQDANKVSLEAGNTPDVVFPTCHQLVSPSDAERWFSISPSSKQNVVSLEE